jgi:signal transduction histidine kinase
MKIRSIAICILMVLMPMILLSWAALQLERNEQIAVQQRFRDLVGGRLQDVNKIIGRTLASIDREMQEVLRVDDVNADQLRALTRNQPRVFQVFAITDRGDLLYPDPTQFLNTQERNFLLNTSKMFTSQAVREAVQQMETPIDRTTDTNRSVKQKTQNSNVNVYQEAHGWFVWYWDRGLHLICWQRRPNGMIVGAALERSRWMADLIAELPETPIAEETQSAPRDAIHFRLINDSSETVYAWGAFDPSSDATPIIETPVAFPLQSWRLQAFVPSQVTNVQDRKRWWTWGSLLLAIGLGLSSLALILYRDHRRSVQEALQQVTFVNQVSHELKTPLTNIQLYAELLQKDLSNLRTEPDALTQSNLTQPNSRLDIIISETQRLGRLINNVLSHARQQRGELLPIPRERVPDEVILSTLQMFEPSLEAAGIRIELDLQTNQMTRFDSDFLEQILGNLISNVEKHAAAGKWLQIESTQTEGRLIVLVRDRGPGIERRRQNELFQPFARLSNRINSTTGTGLGLSIARQQARLHGGDLQLLSSKQGCCFQFELTTKSN